jgi:hypothetical protein
MASAPILKADKYSTKKAGIIDIDINIDDADKASIINIDINIEDSEKVGITGAEYIATGAELSIPGQIAIRFTVTAMIRKLSM